ncbi:MAG TPA: DUF4340 domain-containing protein, partial [Acidiferrobacterales bacterium]|nr:DUF4340 domain-containing protein [Acidiferrobacterales bacterium]
MKNRWLLNIGLTLLVGALVLLVLYKPGSKKEAEGTPLTALTADVIQRIRLVRPKQPDIVLEKSGADWRLTAPRTARANEFRVNELLRLVATPVSTRFPAAPAEYGKYGLDLPLATLFLNDAEIRFGGMHPLDNQLYVLHDSQVQLIPTSVFRAVSAPLTDFLSTSLIEDKAKLLAFRFPAFGLKQNEQGAWARTPELKGLGSDQVNRFVDEWRHARALSAAPYSGKPVKERVTLTLANGDQQRVIEFGVLAYKPEFI